MIYLKGRDDGTTNIFISDLNIINESDSNKEALKIESCNFHTRNINIKNFHIGYNLINCNTVNIESNYISLPFSLNKIPVRAVIFTTCKSIILQNNKIIFESALDFERIRKNRLVKFTSRTQY